MKRVFAAVLAVTLSIGTVHLAPSAAAAGTVTIYPNYANANCGKKGFAVTHVKVAAFPGGTTVNASGQRWAKIKVPSRGKVRLVANLQCQNVALKRAVQWVTVTDYVTNPVANRSYYF